MENEFIYPDVLNRGDRMYKEAKKIAHDNEIFSGKLLEKHFAEGIPMYLDESYYCHENQFPRIVQDGDDFKAGFRAKLKSFRDCHYYTLYDFEGHRFYIMTGGRYD